jgi:hypothetical protein
MSTREHALLASCLAALLALLPGTAPGTGARAYAADLQVERLELLTHGSLNEVTGSFEAATRLYFDLAIAGGDKFGGILRLDFLNGGIEEALKENSASLPPGATLGDLIDRINALTSPRFRTASITAKGFAGLPLDLTYFVGLQDTFASGDDFVPLFGASPFASSLRGPMVYPEGVGGDPELFYEGLHAVNGTGLRLGTSPKLSSSFVSYLYLYQDSDLGKGFWSGDIRALLNSQNVKLELFAGASTDSSLGIYRGGLLFFASPGDIGEFFLQAGIPRWDPAAGFTVDNLYFLFEPRINFSFGTIALTVFYHPGYYRQKPTGEKSALDTAFNLRIGHLDQGGAQGGLESLLKFRPQSAEPLAVDVSPYYSAIAGGVEWDFKLGLRVFPFPSPWYGMLKPFIGLKTSF